VSDAIQNPPRCSFVAIVGPTAVGKSDLAMRIAALRDVEIVNADSRQVYRYMDIGTSKPTREDQAMVTHHLLDVVDPDEDFSLADYLQRARIALREVSSRGRLPILVGGSGQYVWALLEGWNVAEVPPDVEFRREMEQLAALQGHRALHEQLVVIDEEAGRRIQSTNIRRVIRALELFRATGVRPSDLLARKLEMAADTTVIGLTLDRPLLFARVDARIATMVAGGFLDEVKTLLAMGYDASLPSMSSIGYRQLADVVTGRIDLDSAKELIARETRRLVRRQYSWFRLSDRRIMWLNAQDASIAARQADNLIQGRLG